MKLSGIFQTTFFCTVILAAGCGSEAKELDAADLIGRWDVREALRNGQPTGTLDQLYFEFFEDGTMRTNLPNMESATYVVEGNLIKQRESPIQTDYTIESLTDTAMVLTTTISNYPFRFTMSKVVMEK
ncbi:MAG TPA: hypothetical protein PKE06_17905 [Flavilitoribacter sp.]|nr:hypothetical protein [Lewinella sp.]MCB9280732.1 hypothetical protein [Lewinellaceae bacterium]HMQ62558.1 hypothetical protein [Flavilitoribacter sp.]HMQ88896.1 hypothetical protein [Flavilitoribacter sp.]